ncbi:viroplasmin family protein [Brevibacillus sp. NPDC058079]|uniref:ribonuclease H1 domain-containing protein n=1 Tax=Brevibacillus sp. NPDC058079 TaxID=3346330 RepID=UPI0036EFA08E
MAKAKFYAIKNGVNPKTGSLVRNQICKTWAEAEPLIRGVKDAEYKSFGSWDEAQNYLKGNSVSAGKTKKLYAIKYGQDPVTKKSIGGIILSSWAEAEPIIKGVKGAEYKSFTNRPEAEAYLQGESSSVAVNLEMQPDVLYCYVDGSFNKDIPNYSFGLCCVLNQKVIHTDNGIGKNPDAIEMQQVGGELLGAITALLYAKSHSLNKVVILHDYNGVANHATGTWKRVNDFSKTYYDWMQNFFKNNPGMTVNFMKVTAHAGNDFNEIADGLAKLAVGIKPDPIFYRMLEKHAVTIEE